MLVLRGIGEQGLNIRRNLQPRPLLTFCKRNVHKKHLPPQMDWLPIKVPREILTHVSVMFFFSFVWLSKEVWVNLPWNMHCIMYMPFYMYMKKENYIHVEQRCKVTYPKNLWKVILAHTLERGKVWDCSKGNKWWLCGHHISHPTVVQACVCSARGYFEVQHETFNV